MLQKLLVPVATLIFLNSPAHATYSAEFTATATEFPQVVVIAYTGTNTRINALLISERFAITYNYLRPGEEDDTEAFSVKLCPEVPSYTPVSLRDADQFNYQSNTTGKIVYFDAIAGKLKYVTTDIWTGAACADDNSNAPTTFRNFNAEKMTCAPYDSADNSCKHLCYDSTNSRNCFPVLVIDSLNAAILYTEVECKVDSANTYKTDSVMPFHKMSYIKSAILENAKADLI